MSLPPLGQLVVGLWLACQAPTMPSNERAALCTLADLARERLDAVAESLDEVITGKQGDAFA